MLSFPGSLRVFVALESCDMRKGHNGLLALVSEQLEEDVRGGAIFVFSNRRHDRLKMLYFDGSGLWLLSKRLERGTFAWPKSVEPGQRKLRLAPEALAMLTDGIDLRGARMRPWYERE
jgi:transposase